MAPDNSCYRLLKVVVVSDFISLFAKPIWCVLPFIAKLKREGKSKAFPW